jgi:hypothetical protein
MQPASVPPMHPFSHKLPDRFVGHHATPRFYDALMNFSLRPCREHRISCSCPPDREASIRPDRGAAKAGTPTLKRRPRPRPGRQGRGTPRARAKGAEHFPFKPAPAVAKSQPKIGPYGLTY